uniref:Uncharacterized protein n=1 Tax=Arundo donax TaxID=35708 RepID=A0A0A8YFB4_ARUDO
MLNACISSSGQKCDGEIQKFGSVS